MTDIEARIASLAPRNNELIGLLGSTDYAEAALKQQHAYVTDLENELNNIVKNIKLYETTTRVEQKQFQKYRDSNIKRFAYKLGGSKGKDKFQSKTEKEEKDYHEAFEKERAAKDRKEALDAALREGYATRDNYHRDNCTHQQAQKDLDDIYSMVFNGPTPAFPAEDQSEWELTQSRERYNAVEQRFRTIHQTTDILAEARKHIRVALMHMGDARSASQWDMMGGGTMADMAERSALSRAESSCAQVRALVSQARRVFPEGVRDIGQFDVATGNLLGDVLFDNLFSDMHFHEKIKASQTQIQQACQNLDSQFENLRQQLNQQKQALDIEQGNLDAARRALQHVRTNIFSQVAQGPPPPAYS